MLINYYKYFLFQILSPKANIKILFLKKKVKYLIQFKIRFLKFLLVLINKTKFYFNNHTI